MVEEVKECESFATKYRPTKFSDIVGQREIKAQIKGMLTGGVLPKALLLTGETGCGKTTIARIIARYVNKVQDICDFNDIYEVNIGTDGTADAIRDLIVRTRTMPKDPKHKKIFILDEVHRLTKASSSGLLKVIEEPPPFVLFLLCTNEPNQLLDTLRNRCEKIILKKYEVNDIVELLRKVCDNEGISEYLNDSQLQLIAEKCNLQPRDCLSTLQGVYNQIKGQGSVSQKDIEGFIESNSELELFDSSNLLLEGLFNKDIVTCVQAIDLSPDIMGIVNIAAAAVRDLIRYIVASVNSKYKPQIGYRSKKTYDKVEPSFGKDLNKGLTYALCIQRLLLQVKQEMLRSGFDPFDNLMVLTSEWCLKED